LYRPRPGEELSFVPFAPPPVTTARVDLADSALQHAAEFWRRAAADAGISAPFRTLCATNLEAVQVAGHGPRVIG
ncbi:MAG TPA: hypothetical protein VHN12_05590, partial [Geobacteraceae bacterium]|nr:hypothetical protein [Geobacteraceae bacterium]